MNDVTEGAQKVLRSEIERGDGCAAKQTLENDIPAKEWISVLNTINSEIQSKKDAHPELPTIEISTEHLHKEDGSEDPNKVWAHILYAGPQHFSSLILDEKVNVNTGKRIRDGFCTKGL